MKNYDVIIIGGGISGLSLAFLLTRMDRKVLVLEKDSQPGGCIRSLTHEDYSIDLGAHTGYNSYTSLLQLFEHSALLEKIVARKKLKYYFSNSGKFQKLIKNLHWGELLWHLPNAFHSDKKELSVKEHYSKIMGNRNYRKLGHHFFKAVLSQNADEYPATFFLKKRNKRNKKVPRSFTFAEGMQAIVNEIQGKINIEVNATINSIEKESSCFSINCNKNSYHTDKIAFATSPKTTAKLCEKIAPNLAKNLATIPTSIVSSLGIVVPKEEVKAQDFAGLLTKSDSFTSIVSRDTFPNKRYRGFTIHSQGENKPEVLKDILCKILHISPRIIKKEAFKTSYLPKLTKNHEDFLETVQAELESTPGVFLTGNYFEGMSLEDCINRSKEEALRLVSQ